MIRVFLADDHAVVRHGLRQLIEGTGEMIVIAEAYDGRAVLNAPELDQCDVLVLDLSLPRVAGLEVVRRLRGREQPRVLVLSMYAEEQYATRLLHEGASAYLSKTRPAEELLAAIHALAEGRTYRPPGAADPAYAKDGLAPHERLSAREYQVFTLLFQGRSMVEIAAELDLCASTVSNHVAHIKKKLDVRTVGDIVGYAHRAGLVE